MEHVVAGDRARAVDAACRDRAADRRVLPLVLDVEVVELGADGPRRLAEERPSRALRQPDDVGRVRALVDHVVEIVVRVHPLAHDGAVRSAALACLAPKLPGQLCEARFRRLQLGQAVVVETRNREGGRQRLELGAHEERLTQLVARQRPDADAPVRDELDEPERRQSPQRLADRRAGDSVLLGKRLLAQDRAGLDLPRDDLLLEGVRDLVGLRGLHAAASRGCRRTRARSTAAESGRQVRRRRTSAPPP